MMYLEYSKKKKKMYIMNLLNEYMKISEIKNTNTVCQRPTVYVTQKPHEFHRDISTDGPSFQELVVRKQTGQLP